MRSHIMKGGLTLTKMTLCKDTTVKSDTPRVLVTFSLHESFWPPQLHYVTPLPLGLRSDPRQGVRIEFATGFLTANNLHKCGKILAGKSFSTAPIDAYCSCDMQGGGRAAATAQTAKNARSNADNAMERIKNKARKTVHFPGSAAGSSGSVPPSAGGVE